MIHEKNPVNQYRGRRNRAEGKTFEGLIEQSLHYYNASGAAAIHKMAEPMNPTKSLGGGKFVAFFAKKAMADYRGTLQGGRAIVFEAKHTVNDRMDFGVVLDQQRADLERNHNLGAVCFVLIGFNMTDMFRIPWTVWRGMKEHFGRKYVKPEELEEYRVPTGQFGTYLILNGIRKDDLTKN